MTRLRTDAGDAHERLQVLERPGRSDPQIPPHVDP